MDCSSVVCSLTRYVLETCVGPAGIDIHRSPVRNLDPCPTRGSILHSSGMLNRYSANPGVACTPLRVGKQVREIGGNKRTC